MSVAVEILMALASFLGAAALLALLVSASKGLLWGE